ncbi:hypothetical protein [Mesorhizobium sp. M0895]|uniref:hypothetical protein n=1 Tax=Mesorhizobium sp. M0895 TaxID=2957019 RepID=UPI003336C09D
MSARPFILWFSRLIATSVLATTLLFSTLSFGQQNTITPEDRRAIGAAAAAVEADTAQFEVLLRNFGFPSPELAAEWRGIADWTIDRQLEAAWRAAEQAVPNSGEEFLRAYARQVAPLNNAIRHEEVLRHIFPEPLDSEFRPEPIRKFKFARPLGARATEPLPPRIKAILPTIAEHATGYPGGLMALVRQCCSVEEARALEKILTANNMAEVLEDALRNGGFPPELKAKLAKLLEIVAKQNLALAYADSMAPYREALERLAMKPQAVPRARAADLPMSLFPATPTAEKRRLMDALVAELGDLSIERGQRPEAGPSVFSIWRDNFKGGEVWPGPDEPPGGGGGGGGKSFSFGDVLERGFDFGNYGRGGRVAAPGGGGHVFTVMRGFFGGKGGVIFGSEVTGASDLPAPVSVTWAPLDGAGQPLSADRIGTFLFLFSDGTVSASPPLSADDALAMVRLVFTGVVGAADTAVKGEGIGLAGAGQRAWHFSIEDGAVVSAGAGFAFYLHPAISDLSMGPVAMITDGFPFIPPLRNKLSAAAKDQSADASLTDELERFLFAFDKGNYKIVDVPMEIYRPHPKVLGVRRTGDGTANFPTSHLESYFLDMQTFDDIVDETTGRRLEAPHRPTPNDPSFYRLMPLLTSLSSDYARLNSFARSLGIIRWAAENGARWTGTLDIPPSGQAFGTLFISENNELAFGPDLYEVLFHLTAAVDDAGKHVLAEARADQAMLDLDAKVSSYEQHVVAVSAIGALRKAVGPGFYGDQYAPNATNPDWHAFEDAESSDSVSGMALDRHVIEKRWSELGDYPLAMPEHALSNLLPTEITHKRADLQSELQTATGSQYAAEERLEYIDELGSTSAEERLYTRWQLASESVRTAAQADYDAWANARSNSNSDDEARFAQKLDAVVPNPTPSEIDEMRTATTAELTEIMAKIADLKQAITETSPRGFEAWYRLHVSLYYALRESFGI